MSKYGIDFRSSRGVFLEFEKLLPPTKPGKNQNSTISNRLRSYYFVKYFMAHQNVLNSIALIAGCSIVGQPNIGGSIGCWLVGWAMYNQFGEFASSSQLTEAQYFQASPIEFHNIPRSCIILPLPSQETSQLWQINSDFDILDGFGESTQTMSGETTFGPDQIKLIWKFLMNSLSSQKLNILVRMLVSEKPGGPTAFSQFLSKG